MIELDMLVIGTGPAGQKASIQAAKLGKNVGICERRAVVGGVCINSGTIPSKTFREAVLYLTGYRQRGIYGSSFSQKQDLKMADLLFRCQHVIEQEIDVVTHQLHRNSVRQFEGEATFLDPHTLMIVGHRGLVEVRADYVVIATGTTPGFPDGVELDGQTVISSDGILDLRELPRTMTVVGAGVIGTEYASMFAALGVEVVLVDRRTKLLEFLDSEIAESLTYQMRDMNCTFRLGEEVDTVRVEQSGRAVAMLKSGKKLVSNVLFYSAGRVGATGELNLEAAGLKAGSRGFLKVNHSYQTAQPHIFAVGDVVGFPSLASTSMEQGRIAACNAFGFSCSSMPEFFPFGIYSVPEIAMVGKHEQELTQAGVPYEVGVARYREIAKGGILGDDTGLLKLLFHRETRRVLGVHIIGTDATELIHIGQAVITLGGTVDYFVNTVFNYPTFAECYKVAALDGFNKVGPAGAEPMPPDSDVGLLQ
jgi:NAD(P) transhydrogenase